MNAIDHGLLYQEFLDPKAVASDFITYALQLLLEAGVALSRSTHRRLLPALLVEKSGADEEGDKR